MDKQSKMFLLAKQWEESGLTRKVFAKKHGITFRSLEYWYRKQKKQQASESNHKTNELNFFEVGLLAHPVTANKQENLPSGNPSPQIVLTFPSGLTLKIY